MASTRTAPIATPAAPQGKRVNFILSEKSYLDLTTLAESNHRTMTDMVRLGLSLVKIAMEASKNGNCLVVTTAEGRPIKEIVLPD